jgi:hypothetical protein
LSAHPAENVDVDQSRHLEAQYAEKSKTVNQYRECPMFWFRHHQARLIHLAIVLWVLAFGMALTQGCLAQPSHNLVTTHVSHNTAQDVDRHDAHDLGCIQHCADAAIAVSPSLHVQMLDPSSWTFPLLIPALLILYPAPSSAFAFLALRRPVPSRPPARLMFVRFND